MAKKSEKVAEVAEVEVAEVEVAEVAEVAEVTTEAAEDLPVEDAGPAHQGQRILVPSGSTIIWNGVEGVTEDSTVVQF